MVLLPYRNKIMDKRFSHNLTWLPIFLIGLIAMFLGIVWCVHDEPWLLDKSPNEVLLQNSFDNLFSDKINIGLPAYLTVIYRFFGLWLLTVGSLIIIYIYVTRLGTEIARNAIFIILFATLMGIYYLVFTYLPSSPLFPVLYILTLCLLCSIFFSKHLSD